MKFVFECQCLKRQLWSKFLQLGFNHFQHLIPDGIYPPPAPNVLTGMRDEANTALEMPSHQTKGFSDAMCIGLW